VNRNGHGHLACKFPINVTVPIRLLRGDEVPHIFKPLVAGKLGQKALLFS